MERLEDRLAAIERLLRDPPAVHLDAPGQVWSTSPECYRFIARFCPPGTRTLETGCGVSTILFAIWGAEHRCVVPVAREAIRSVGYIAERMIDYRPPRIEVGFSSEVLPSLEVGELDLYLIDGGHAFPDPAIDWFYGARWLRRGGVLVIDDAQLPAVKQLTWFLDRDPRWTSIADTRKWVAYERAGEGALAEPWTKQWFFRSPASVLDTSKERIRGMAGRAYRSVFRR